MIKELQHLLYHERLREMELRRVETEHEKVQGKMWINTQLEGMKKRQTKFSQYCPLIGKEVMSTDKKHDK